ncbi:hypothetical protein HanLR1_Chr14g0555811 [Helianthus annuus]|nr:hypothetical protein HanLR1_Chr14g0555811 [Helianthus annuus]
MSSSYFLPLLQPSPTLHRRSHLSSFQIKLKPTCRSMNNHNSSDATLVFAPTYGNSSRRCVKVRSNFSFPLISPSDHWGNWTALFSIGAIGSWSEKTTIGNMLSGALMSTLIGLVASNLGLISSEAHAYPIVLEYLLPLAVPLLLFRADMFRVFRSTGKLLLAFLIGSVATTVGTVVAYWMVPMRQLGGEGWKIAAALMGRHIGGGNGPSVICIDH